MFPYFDAIFVNIGLENDDAAADATSLVDWEAEAEDQLTLGILKPVIQATPLSVMSMTVLSIVMLSEFLSANVSSPFIFFMVKDFGVDEVAFWTGILVSTFFGSQFAASLLWTTIAAYTSPRLVLILTLLGSAVSTVFFGCSKTLEVAVVARLAQGIFAGGVGVAKGAVAGITDESNESAVWTILGFFWGMGGIAGAVLGGLFERPAAKWEVFERVVLFRDFPYFLPCAIASTVMLIGGILACFLAPDIGPRNCRVFFDTEKPTPVIAVPLPSINQSASQIPSIRAVNPQSIVKKVSVARIFSDPQTPLLSCSVPAAYCATMNDAVLPPSRAGSRTRWCDSLGRKSYDTPVSNHGEGEEDGTPWRGRGRPLHRGSLATSVQLLRSHSVSRHRNVTPIPVTRSDNLNSEISISVSFVDRMFPRSDTVDSGVSFIPEPPVPHPLPLAQIPESTSSLGAALEKEGQGSKNELPIDLIIQYGLLALHTTTHDQVFLAYFTGSYKEGGLGLGAGEFAGLIAVMCVFQLGYQFYFYSKIGPPNGPFTHLTLFRLSWFLYIISYLSVALYRGVFSGGPLMVVLVGSTAIRYCGNTLAFTSVAILINAMTPLSSIGHANGVAQSVVSLARCFGPVLGGLIWSVSTDPDPSMYWMSFVVCAGICVGAVIHGVFTDGGRK